MSNFASKLEPLRKFWKISRTVLLSLIGLIILAWLLIQTTPVQNFIVKRVTSKLSNDLNTTVNIRHVDFDLFNTMLLEGTLIKDRQKDTLLYAGTAKVLITDWFFFKDTVSLKYVGLQDAVLHLERTDSIWNWKFLADYFSTPPGRKKKNRQVQLNLKQVELDNVAIIQKDGWRGENLSAVVRSLDVDVERFDPANNIIRVRSIDLDRPSFAIYNYNGNRPSPADSLVKNDETPIINDPHHLRWNPGEWNVMIDRVSIHDGSFKTDQKTERPVYASFDGQHILFSGIDADFKNVRLQRDSITTSMELSAKERSGFQIKKLKAEVLMHPEAMEFAGLDLRTNRSRLQNYFIMRYPSFDDMNDFITKVRMEANFRSAEISSDDIAYFAPELNTWKKKISITGTIKGTVENLNGKHLVIQAGKNTYLNGDISISGLPAINKTYIDFVANDFRTTYEDAMSFIPSLRSIEQPRLDLLKYLRFKGNFTGFIQDFVSYGTIETALGTLRTDLNMKLPDNAVSSYSGNIKTSDFNIGSFINNTQLGKISFEGKINGRGLTARTVNSQLDGTISLLEFNQYSYRDITVKGKVAKKLFNGELVSNDPNLQLQLNGLIDFNQQIPQFNFEAAITKADLKNLRMTADDIDFNGKFRFNFSGSNIDNFLGTARVYDASVFRKGQRISFDSLFVESKILDKNKVITVLSNEFDAALVGEFSLRDLPSSFQTFLNRYYPSYIKPSRSAGKNENFSFVISTKKVDEYIGLFDPRLSGFNFSTITGRINSKENLLDLNAEVPQFNFRNVAFYGLNVKGTGSFDSLSLETNIENIYINDSLHFPGTYIKVLSSKDISDINIRGSASQTLNTANLNARVKTLPEGAQITFMESNFDLNGKNWVINKNGELVLTKNLISAEGIRLYNGQQEILVTTYPSDIGNTNDIKVELNKVNIGDFSPYLISDMRLEGLMNGNVTISDPFRRLGVEFTGEADQFRLDDDSIGKITMHAAYDKQLGKVNFTGLSENNNYHFNLQGIYNLADSTKKDQVDVMARVRDTKISLLEKYLSGVFSQVDGFATGDLHIIGPANNLDYLGKVTLHDGGLRVKYTNVYYNIPDATFDFLDDRIDFGKFAVTDTFGNTGQITRGTLYHEGFNKLSFDFAMNTRKLLVLATTDNGSDPYYGTVIARANMTLRGPLDAMEMNVTGAPADSSSLYINAQGGHENSQADFVVWKVYGREMQPEVSPKESNLNIHLDVTANNYANLYVILDALTGDIIKANGRGNLQIQANTDGEFTMTGRYDIDRGYYNFNFESLLRKPFRLREGVGNYIQWTGDPNNALIKIDAEYEAENVRFSDLNLDSYAGKEGSGISDNISSNVRKYRGKILVVASLTGELNKPDIKFKIELPQGSPLRSDLFANEILKDIQDDENELNKQVAFLIVFNSFGPSSTSPNQGSVAGTAFEGIVVNNISGVLSNTLSRQFSNIVQKIFNDKSIRVNFSAQLYSGTNFLTNYNSAQFIPDRTNLNLSVGKSVFNERLTFTFGSAADFGLSTAQINATRNLPFLPDVNAEWKITPDGKLVLTFFYRDSYNYLNLGARENRSGAGISYRRDFDRLSDLFGSNKKRRRVIPTPARDSTGTE